MLYITKMAHPALTSHPPDLVFPVFTKRGSHWLCLECNTNSVYTQYCLLFIKNSK